MMRVLCLACLALVYLAMLTRPAHGPAHEPGEGVWRCG
jgi:hypothetical protein